jgi:hypothetical protein
MPEVTYSPIDTLKPVAENIWIVDSGPLKIAGMPIPVRMTVIRLRSGSLLLHSPTKFGFELKARLEDQGPIGYLVAPNTAHWSFIEEWQSHCPDTECWAAPGLKERPVVAKSNLRIHNELSNLAPAAWSDEIETVIVPGMGLTEVAFFHRPTKTLVLTDLVVNVEPDKLPLLEAIGAKLVGASAPHGKAPIYARMAILAKRDEASTAARKLVDLQPERVIFAHGKWFEADGTRRLRQSLDWLLK